MLIQFINVKLNYFRISVPEQIILNFVSLGFERKAMPWHFSEALSEVL